MKSVLLKYLRSLPIKTIKWLKDSLIESINVNTVSFYVPSTSNAVKLYSYCGGTSTFYFFKLFFTLSVSNYSC